MKSRKLLIVSGILSLILLVSVFGSLKQSSIYNFPIPIIAQINGKHSESYISYDFNGINSLYIQHVKLFGWKEIEVLGSKKIFEKDGKKIAITTYKDGFDLAIE
ncbi:hypothetical protein QGM71_20160 [Virgibacillus sp. C22-A2]|uniref:DUF3139 domain-containing protein n=1 Tax=Virgibacillus tibetensis TaxID=3042313 RepID=A0ABU6KKN7_9BACI|nr:hypothetical protein [Virgibacillus sp. C22-A2]